MIGKTMDSHQVWQTPDGKRTIWDVILQSPDGKNYKLKTFSTAISRVGFEGDVQSYESKNGERFVRQAPKPAEQTAGQPAAESRDHNIRAQWAIGQAINLASATMEPQKITMPLIEQYAKDLFATVSRVTGETFTDEMRDRAAGYISRNMPQPAGSAA